MNAPLSDQMGNIAPKIKVLNITMQHPFGEYNTFAYYKASPVLKTASAILFAYTAWLQTHRPTLGLVIALLSSWFEDNLLTKTKFPEWMCFVVCQSRSGQLDCIRCTNASQLMKRMLLLHFLVVHILHLYPFVLRFEKKCQWDKIIRRWKWQIL